MHENGEGKQHCVDIERSSQRTSLKNIVKQLSTILLWDRVEISLNYSHNLALAPTGLADLDILSTFTSTWAKAPVLFGT